MDLPLLSIVLVVFGSQRAHKVTVITSHHFHLLYCRICSSRRKPLKSGWWKLGRGTDPKGGQSEAGHEKRREGAGGARRVRWQWRWWGWLRLGAHPFRLRRNTRQGVRRHSGYHLRCNWNGIGSKELAISQKIHLKIFFFGVYRQGWSKGPRPQSTRGSRSGTPVGCVCE